MDAIMQANMPFDDRFYKIEANSFAGGCDTTSPDGNVGAPRSTELQHVTTTEIDTFRTMIGATTRIPGQASHPGGRSLRIATSVEVLDFVFTNGKYYYLIKSGTDYKFISNVGGVETLIAQWTPDADFGGTAVGIDSQECKVILAGDYVVAVADRIHLYNTRSGRNRRAGYFASRFSITNQLWVNSATGGFYKDGIPGTVASAYQYCCMEQDPDGAMSNPGPLSSGYYYNQRAYARISSNTSVSPLDASIGVGYVPGTIAPGKIWVFRIGESNSVFRLVGIFTPKVLAVNTALPDGTAALAGDIIDSATGNYFYDNVPDSQLPDVFLSYSNLPPPGNVRTACYADGMLYFAGLGTSIPDGVRPNYRSCIGGSYLWHTRPNLIDSVGYDDNGVDDDGGYNILDGEPDDDILQIETIAGIKIVGRKKSLFAVYGSGFLSSRYDRRSNIGIASRRAMCRCGNVIRYVASDRTVREMNSGDGEVISEKIRTSLRALDSASFGRCVTFYHDSVFYISFPVGTTPESVVCFAYDEINRAWYEFSSTAVATNYFRCNSAKSIGGSLLVARTVDETTMGIYNQNDQTLVNTDTPMVIETELRPFDNTQQVGRFVAIYLEGSITQGTTPLTLTLTSGSVSYSYNFSSTSGVLVYYLRLQPDLVGLNLKARISGQWKSGAITKLIMGYVLVRGGF